MFRFRKKYSVKRLNPGSYINGFWQEGSETIMTIQASIQPIRGEELQMLPEGRRSSHSVRVYTDTALETVDNENPDRIVIDDAEYEILSVESWQSGVINHYKCIAVKVENT